MARRKHETQLQQEIETTEEWEELMAKEGLFGNLCIIWVGAGTKMQTQYLPAHLPMTKPLFHQDLY